MEKLTMLEQCEEIIKSKQGVLYLKGRPGEGKTALLKSIAEKNGWQYFDFRLSQRDSSEVIGVPFKEVLENGVTVMKYAIPIEYTLANEKPTLIVYEELNRAELATRNAALQILLERTINTFKFDKDVYFASTGNLGDTGNSKDDNDGCDVEEFDRALKSRLAILRHDLTFKEWHDNFAKKNINPFIVEFIKNNMEHWYKAQDNEDTITCVRSYTFFSNFIGKNNKNLEDILEKLANYGARYLHSSTVACLTRYLQNLTKITLNDIINRFDEIQPVLDTMNKSFLNEFCEKLKTLKVSELTDKQVENVIKFLQYMPDDEKCGFLHWLIEETTKEEHIEDYTDKKNKITEKKRKEVRKDYGKNFITILTAFKDLLDILEKKSEELSDDDEDTQNSDSQESNDNDNSSEENDDDEE